MQNVEAPGSARRFELFAWGVTLYTLFVILWGALVRITGSGAGCGQHWPTCHGEVIPVAPSFETLIEFTHRLTSGLCIPLILVLVVWAYRRAGVAGRAVGLAIGGGVVALIGGIAASAVTKSFVPALVVMLAGLAWVVWLSVRSRRYGSLVLASMGSLVFILTEALIGAALVLLEFVAENASVYRGIWMAGHLINTFVLMGWMCLVLWHAKRPQPIRLLGRGVWSSAILALTAAILVMSAAGAISALGHTLFPADPAASLMDHVRNDPWIETNYPMLVRIVHPALAMLTSMGLWAFALRVHDQFPGVARRRAHWMAGAVLVQVICGFVSIWIHAPGWMQLLHLGLANVVWITWMFLVFELGSTDAAGEPSLFPSGS